MKKNLLRLNLIIGLVWLFVNGSVYKNINTDLTSNDPLTLSQYIEKGGSSFDYYIGYAFLTTTCDQANYEDHPRILRGGSVARAVFIMGFIALWLWGFITLMSLSGCFMDETDKKLNKLPKATGYYVTMSAITTIITLYWGYYMFVYVSKFWLQ